MAFLRLIETTAGERAAAGIVDIQSKSRTAMENNKRAPVNIPRAINLLLDQ
jgi:hypothetical protein